MAAQVTRLRDRLHRQAATPSTKGATGSVQRSQVESAPMVAAVVATSANEPVAKAVNHRAVIVAPDNKPVVKSASRSASKPSGQPVAMKTTAQKPACKSKTASQDRLAQALSKSTTASAAANAKTALVDHRKAPRKKSSLPAFISVDGRQRMISCTIIDMSATGARLQVLCADRHIRENVLGFPDIVTLFITFDKLRVDCEIAWRNSTQNRIGLRFLTVPQSYS